MADPFKNFMIGLFVIISGVIIVFILMFLHPTIGDERKTLLVRFTDIDKVTPGTRVTYAGKPVGEVVDIKEVEYGRNGPTDSQGHVYLYELKLHVDSGVRVYNTDQVSLRTSGLLGEKSVEITPIAPKPGEKLVIIDDKVLYAIESGSVEETFRQFKTVAGKIDVALDSLTKILDKIRSTEIVENVASTIENVKSITAALNIPQDISETVQNIHTLSTKAVQSWDSVDKTIHDIDQAALGATTLVNDMDHRITNGEGTLGKLLNDDALYLRTNSIMSKLETTMDDINHYGLMFHSDKGWQRLRARRLNLLQKLRTPQEFRNYFNDEVNQISTSLTRVYMVLNELEQDPYCANMGQDRDFMKVFAELMRRVTMLEEEVRMYNTQLVETQVHETELGNPPLCPCNDPCPDSTYCQ